MAEAITYTADQERAIEMGVQLVQRQRRRGANQDGGQINIARLVGYAGTGKTTTLKAIVKAVGEDTVVVAPTGKAARRAAQFTKNAQTFHRWLFQVEEIEIRKPPRPDGELVRIEPAFRIKIIETPESGLVIVDEASMLARVMWNALWYAARKYNFAVLLVGDDFQLPPVEKAEGTGAGGVGGGEGGIKLLDEKNQAIEAPTEPLGADRVFRPLRHIKVVAEVVLDQPMRQAEESLLLRAATFLRRNGWRRSRSVIAQLPRRSADQMLEHDARNLLLDGTKLIVWKNATRKMANALIRARLGVEGPPQPNEPMLIKKNSYQLELWNGQLLQFPGLAKAAMQITNPKSGLPLGTELFALNGILQPRWCKRAGYRGRAEDGGEDGDSEYNEDSESRATSHTPLRPSYPYRKHSFVERGWAKAHWVAWRDRLNTVSDSESSESALVSAIRGAPPCLFKIPLIVPQLMVEDDSFGYDQSLFSRAVSRQNDYYRGLWSWSLDDARQFAFLHAVLGYAVTCHSAQGSEWPDVYVADECRPMGKDEAADRDAARWLYTAITRAQNNAFILGTGE